MLSTCFKPVGVRTRSWNCVQGSGQHAGKPLTDALCTQAKHKKQLPCKHMHTNDSIHQGQEPLGKGQAVPLVPCMHAPPTACGLASRECPKIRAVGTLTGLWTEPAVRRQLHLLLYTAAQPLTLDQTTRQSPQSSAATTPPLDTRYSLANAALVAFSSCMIGSILSLSSS